MENSTLKRRRVSSSGQQYLVSSSRRGEFSERSTTSENGLPDMENMGERDVREEDNIEKDESREVSSGSDGEDGDDEREDDDDENEDVERDKDKSEDDSKDEDEDQEVSKKKDERDEDDSSDSDEKDEITVPRRFPWKKAYDDNDNDVGTADKVEEEAEDKMKQDKYYKKLVKTIDDKELDEDLVKAIWKFVKGGDKRFAHIIGLTLYDTEKEFFDHHLCEEIVERAIQYWGEHKDLSDEENEETENGVDEETKNEDDKPTESDLDKAIESSPNQSKKTEENPPSDIEKELLNSRTYSREELRFRMLDRLIEEDEFKKDVDPKEWFLEELDYYEGGIENVNQQRADRAWQIVRTFGSGFNMSIGATFYLTTRKEIDLEFLEEMLDIAFMQYKEVEDELPKKDDEKD
ncbi:hypothetical protein CRE_23672 [Caenorhabditis remanei]|uniref:Uncharacterized protein n=1 Tax=Caenorhabditis remanei TaxID=31234 RepID=E3N491_CAERE|nr:hypothetical protein CRE_23672 [Caenorhabditis remanei]